MACFLYVDNSNIWIEGTRVSAVANGLATDIVAAQEGKVSDYSWKLDYRRLYEFATGGDEVGRAVLFASRPPANEALWLQAQRRGFEVIVHNRNVRNKEKKIDTGIATAIVSDSYERMEPGRDEITLVAGDSDYVPTVENLRGRGFRVFVTFWDHAARELQTACTRFTPLNGYLDYLSLEERPRSLNP